MKAKHVLEDRRLFWPTYEPFQDKLYGDVNDLTLTAIFFTF